MIYSVGPEGARGCGRQHSESGSVGLQQERGERGLITVVSAGEQSVLGGDWAAGRLADAGVTNGGMASEDWRR